MQPDQVDHEEEVPKRILPESEEERIRREDADFAVIQARARAKARNEKYDPERHGPFATRLVPRIERLKATAPLQVQATLDGI